MRANFVCSTGLSRLTARRPNESVSAIGSRVLRNRRVGALADSGVGSDAVTSRPDRERPILAWVTANGHALEEVTMYHPLTALDMVQGAQEFCVADATVVELVVSEEQLASRTAAEPATRRYTSAQWQSSWHRPDAVCTT